MASTAGVTDTYDGDGINGQVLEEIDLSGNLISDYVYFGSMRIARRDASGSVDYFLAGRLGENIVFVGLDGRQTGLY